MKAKRKRGIDKALTLTRENSLGYRKVIQSLSPVQSCYPTGFERDRGQRAHPAFRVREEAHVFVMLC